MTDADTTPAVSFIRVDPDSAVGGLTRPDVQRWMINEFAAQEGFRIVQRFLEEAADSHGDDIDSRPILQRAVDFATQAQAVILVVSLDRLSHDPSTLAAIAEQGLTVIATGSGVASRPLCLSRYQSPSEIVRQEMGTRIRSGLERARARGVVLGKHARQVLAQANKQAADDRARELAGTVNAKLEQGKSLRTIVQELNAEQVPTPRGGRWHLASVQRLVERIRNLD